MDIKQCGSGHHAFSFRGFSGRARSLRAYTAELPMEEKIQLISVELKQAPLCVTRRFEQVRTAIQQKGRVPFTLLCGNLRVEKGQLYFR
jgi:hypothetical protein